MAQWQEDSLFSSLSSVPRPTFQKSSLPAWEWLQPGLTVGVLGPSTTPKEVILPTVSHQKLKDLSPWKKCPCRSWHLSSGFSGMGILSHPHLPLGHLDPVGSATCISCGWGYQSIEGERWQAAKALVSVHCPLWGLGVWWLLINFPALCVHRGENEPLEIVYFPLLCPVMSPQVPSGWPQAFCPPGTAVTVGGSFVTLRSHWGLGQPLANDFLFPSPLPNPRPHTRQWPSPHDTRPALAWWQWIQL